MDVEISEFTKIEVKIGGSVGIGIVKISARPVKNWHKIVAHGLYASLSEIGKADFVLLNKLITVRSGILDGLGYRKTLHHAPSQTMVLDVALHFLDLFQSPYLSVRDMMECGHYTLNANLTQHIKGDLVVGSKPTPCFFHR